VSVAAALLIKNPPKGFIPKGWTPPEKKVNVQSQALSPGKVLRTPQFYMIILTFMLATAAGLMVIPFAKKLGLAGGLEPLAAAAGVMVIAGFNSFGRLFWGWVSDRLGRKWTLLILLIIAGVSIPFAAIVQSYWILVLIAVVGFAYGGFLGVFPSLTADYFGMKHQGMNYGMVLFGFGVGAVASSYVAGYFAQVTGGFLIPFLIAAGAALLGAVVVLLLKPPKQKQLAEAGPEEIPVKK
jgi:MFS transporter, OFA family, oxalate/formate antiporter